MLYTQEYRSAITEELTKILDSGSSEEAGGGGHSSKGTHTPQAKTLAHNGTKGSECSLLSLPLFSIVYYTANRIALGLSSETFYYLTLGKQ